MTDDFSPVDWTAVSDAKLAAYLREARSYAAAGADAYERHVQDIEAEQQRRTAAAFDCCPSGCVLCWPKRVRALVGADDEQPRRTRADADR
jgi:hypothetical protein